MPGEHNVNGFMPKRLTAKVAVVTGGGKGIGEAIALRLATEGADIVVADLSEADANGAAERLRSHGFRAKAVQVDIRSPEQVDAMFNTSLAAFGRVDLLINNAGVGLNKPFLETTPADWDRVVRTNLDGTFYCAQAAARIMAQQRDGAIVNTASISGTRGAQNRSAYGASKAGVILLTKVMALELAMYGIRVNAVAPGPVATPMTSVTHTAEIRATYKARIPLQRYAECHEIAAAVAYLASDEARCVTGHTLIVDGGFVAAGLIFDPA